MPKRKAKKAPSRKAPVHRGAEWVVFLGLVLFMASLWGRVRIDTVLRDTAKLEKQKATLIRDINALRVEVNAQKSYAQIAAKARQQGMEVLPASRRAELAVDLGDLYPTQPPEQRVQVAGLGYLGMKTF